MGQGMYLRASRKLHQGLRGDLSLRAKGHFKGGPKTLDETMPSDYRNYWSVARNSEQFKRNCKISRECKGSYGILEKITGIL